MARALHKLQAKITKKRGGTKPTALHENSRDARRLRQAGAREDKIARIASAASKQQGVYIERIAWFSEAVAERKQSEPEKVEWSEEELVELVGEFIAREDAEMEELKAEARPGRPKSRPLERIEARKEVEEKEFESGFWVVDLRMKVVVERLERWGGNWGGLNTLAYVRVKSGGGFVESSFPPKGLS